MLESLTRYDGWGLYLAVFCGFAASYMILRTPWRKMQAYLWLYAVLGGIGIVGWLLWNKNIFGDFLYFEHSIFSSRAQQLPFINSGLDNA